MTNQQKILAAGILLGGLGVAIGAFGAHGLKSILIENNRIDTFELAVRYQFYHAITLLAAGALVEKFDSKRIFQSALFMVIGVFIFSGSLYMLSITNKTALGAITPIGGVLLIVGWILLLISILKKR